MRSTLIIDDDLFRRAKRRAAELNTTLSAVVNQALRASLTETRPEAPPFRMPTFGNPRHKVRHEPADFADVLVREDDESLR